MSDWNVLVTNEELDVTDAGSHELLVEIRDLLKEIVKRLPEQKQP